MKQLSQSIVLEKFYYKDGELLYKSGKRKDKIAGCHKGNYYRICINCNVYQLHRVIFLYFHGYMPEKEVDHIDRNKYNNKIENLREVSWQCNARNSKIEIRNTSGIKGVNWNKRDKYWRAFIKVDGKFYHIGKSNDFVEAVCMRLAAEQALNWGGCDSRSPAFLYIKEYLLTLEHETRPIINQYKGEVNV